MGWIAFGKIGLLFMAKKFIIEVKGDLKISLDFAACLTIQQIRGEAQKHQQTLFLLDKPTLYQRQKPQKDR